MKRHPLIGFLELTNAQKLDVLRGYGLKNIRDGRLYRMEFSDIYKYAEVTHQFTPGYVDQCIALYEQFPIGGDMVEKLSGVEKPKAEPVPQAKPASKRRKQAPVIYVLSAEGSGRVKIGFSRDVQRRIETLKTACPFEIQVLATFRCKAIREESAVHSMFSQFRRAGEWFEYAEPIQRWVADMKSKEETK